MTNAERQKRYREAKRNASVTDSPRNVTESVTKLAATVTDVTPVTQDELVDCFGVRIRPRICTKCPGLTFKDLISHSDHLATHNPSPAQWARAHEIMQAKREKRPCQNG